jgi:hypothetical protein
LPLWWTLVLLLLVSGVIFHSCISRTLLLLLLVSSINHSSCVGRRRCLRLLLLLAGAAASFDLL